MMKVLSRLLCLVLCLPLLVMGQQKITWNKDGKEMVLIPAGSFEMGDHHDNMGSALPVHTVELDAFYMDVHEVTVGQFREFVEDSGYDYDAWDKVAEELGVARQTGNTWKNKNQSFAAELDRQQQELNQENRLQLSGLVSQSIQMLRQSLESEHERLRQSTAVHVLKTTGFYSPESRDQ